MTADAPKLQKDYDHKPCQTVACDCDSHYCDVAWDESCCGYQQEADSSIERNYFANGCSTKILCYKTKPTGKVIQILMQILV